MFPSVNYRAFKLTAFSSAFLKLIPGHSSICFQGKKALLSLLYIHYLLSKKQLADKVKHELMNIMEHSSYREKKASYTRAKMRANTGFTFAR